MFSIWLCCSVQALDKMAIDDYKIHVFVRECYK